MCTCVRLCPTHVARPQIAISASETRQTAQSVMTASFKRPVLDSKCVIKKLHTDLIGVANCFMKCRRRRVRKLLCRPAKILAQPLVNVVDLHHTDQDKSDQDTEMQEGIDDTILINSGAKSTKTRRAKASTSVSVSAANAVAAPDR